MTGQASLFLPGVPEDAVRAALDRAGGNEIESGKFASPESSAALAVNAFGWFLECPDELPPFPGLADLDWPAVKIDVERQMRFPWRAGRHPWLDAAVETERHLIGVESKRFEPFRDAKSVSLSPAYDRDVWGDRMGPIQSMRDRLRSGNEKFSHLDAAQLVKHAFGLVTEGRRIKKVPVLLYLFAEPKERAGRFIDPQAIEKHRGEITEFASAVSGAEVRFAACSYRDWLESWTGEPLLHAREVISRFEP